MAGFPDLEVCSPHAAGQAASGPGRHYAAFGHAGFRQPRQVSLRQGGGFHIAGNDTAAGAAARHLGGIHAFLSCQHTGTGTHRSIGNNVSGGWYTL